MHYRRGAFGVRSAGASTGVSAPRATLRTRGSAPFSSLRAFSIIACLKPTSAASDPTATCTDVARRRSESWTRSFGVAYQLAAGDLVPFSTQTVCEHARHSHSSYRNPHLQGCERDSLRGYRAEHCRLWSSVLHVSPPLLRERPVAVLNSLASVGTTCMHSVDDWA